jgi:hypothetical protein
MTKSGKGGNEAERERREIHTRAILSVALVCAACVVGDLVGDPHLSARHDGRTGDASSFALWELFFIIKKIN